LHSSAQNAEDRYGLISQTADDNVFVDTSTIGKYDLYHLINELSDHAAQLLILNKGEKKGKGMSYLHQKKNQ